jgi:hypothetical protein
MERRGLQVVSGGVEPSIAGVAPDPMDFQADCVGAYVASWTARGFSPVTIENAAGLLDRTLDLLGCPAWEADIDDIDRLVGGLAADGLSVATRRGYVQSFKGFYRFLQVRRASAIESAFGVRLVCPVDELQRGEVLDPPGLEVGLERVVELGEGLVVRQAAELQGASGTGAARAARPPRRGRGPGSRSSRACRLPRGRRGRLRGRAGASGPAALRRRGCGCW